MSDFNVSISHLQEHSNDKERYRVWEQLRQQALLRFETNASGDSDGLGTWLTLWSGTIPENTKWTIQADFIGWGSTGGASYQLVTGVQNIAGVAAPIQATSQITFQREDEAAADFQFDLTGTLFSVQVRDGGVVPMTWKVYISALGTV
jgi:hypothetical protein